MRIKWKSKYNSCLDNIFDRKFYYEEYFLSVEGYKFIGFGSMYAKSVVFTSYIYNYLKREDLLTEQLANDLEGFFKMFRRIHTIGTHAHYEDVLAEPISNIAPIYYYFHNFIDLNYLHNDDDDDKYYDWVDKPILNFIKSKNIELVSNQEIIWLESSLLYAYDYIATKYRDIYQTIDAHKKLDKEIEILKQSIVAEIEHNVANFESAEEIVYHEDRKIYYIIKKDMDNLVGYHMNNELLAFIFLAILNYNCEYIVTYVLDYLAENKQCDKWLEVLATTFVYF